MTNLNELVGKKITGLDDDLSSVTIIAEDDVGEKYFLILEPKSDCDGDVDSSDYWVLNGGQVEQRSRQLTTGSIDKATIEHYKEAHRLKSEKITKENEKQWAARRKTQWEGLNKEFGDGK